MSDKDTSISDKLLSKADICCKAAGISLDRAKELIAFARERNQSIVQVLVERGGVDEHELTQGLASQLDIPLFNEDKQAIPDDVLHEVSPGIAMKSEVIPVGRRNGSLLVAVWDPFDWQHWEDLEYVLNRPIEKVLCSRSVIQEMLRASYGIGADTVERLLNDRDEGAAEVLSTEASDLSDEDAANEPTVVSLVNTILSEAIRANATDIHCEPYEEDYLVRFRIDGLLEDVSIPGNVSLFRHAIVSRIKIMSGLDITETRLPQDGRSQVAFMGQDFDLRVSILPGINGEAVVIRLQSRQMAALSLESLGFHKEEEQKIRQLISRPHGLMLVTGPTGSGKTTTLYSCLNKIISSETKIVTIEDPVEYRTHRILQMQIRDEIGFSFARALRSILRHDPDIILVGEIRDRETAEIAIRSSLTGHLVFATLHTNDAAGAATRLIDMGIEPFLVASSVHGVLAQRLIRKLCPDCRKPLDADSLDELGHQMLNDVEGLTDGELYVGEGCSNCRFTGYRGRMAVGEVLMATPELRQLIQQSSPSDHIKKEALRAGMKSLRDNALLALRNGQTTVEEVLRITQDN